MKLTKEMAMQSELQKTYRKWRLNVSAYHWTILDKKKAYMPDNLDKTCKIYLKWIVYLQVVN